MDPRKRGSALNGGPAGATGLMKVLGAPYADAKEVSTTSFSLQ
jgi:hypothetical protein